MGNIQKMLHPAALKIHSIQVMKEGKKRLISVFSLRESSMNVGSEERLHLATAAEWNSPSSFL